MMHLAPSPLPYTRTSWRVVAGSALSARIVEQEG